MSRGKLPERIRRFKYRDYRFGKYRGWVRGDHGRWILSIDGIDHDIDHGIDE
jgi:hypothetical protein